jgi:hypothetical protein
MEGGASFQDVSTECFWTSTTLSFAPKEAITAWITSSRCVARTIGRCTVVSSSSKGAFRRVWFFRHADGTIYGRVADPSLVTVFEQAFLGLRSLGFREGEARSALERVRASAHVGEVSIESILRHALALLATK